MSDKKLDKKQVEDNLKKAKSGFIPQMIKIATKYNIPIDEAVQQSEEMGFFVPDGKNDILDAFQATAKSAIYEGFLGGLPGAAQRKSDHFTDEQKAGLDELRALVDENKSIADRGVQFLASMVGPAKFGGLLKSLQGAGQLSKGAAAGLKIMSRKAATGTATLGAGTLQGAAQGFSESNTGEEGIGIVEGAGRGLATSAGLGIAGQGVKLAAKGVKKLKNATAGVGNTIEARKVGFSDSEIKKMRAPTAEEVKSGGSADELFESAEKRLKDVLKERKQMGLGKPSPKASVEAKVLLEETAKDLDKATKALDNIADTRVIDFRVMSKMEDRVNDWARNSLGDGKKVNDELGDQISRAVAKFKEDAASAGGGTSGIVSARGMLQASKSVDDDVKKLISDQVTKDLRKLTDEMAVAGSTGADALKYVRQMQGEFGKRAAISKTADRYGSAAMNIPKSERSGKWKLATSALGAPWRASLKLLEKGAKLSDSTMEVMKKYDLPAQGPKGRMLQQHTALWMTNPIYRGEWTKDAGGDEQ